MELADGACVWMEDVDVWSAAETLVLHFLHCLLSPLCATPPRSLRLAFSFTHRNASRAVRRLRSAAQSLYAMQCALELSRLRLTCTERDVYYRRPLLFLSPKAVPRALRRLRAWLCAVSSPLRGALRVRASGRALRLAAAAPSVLLVVEKESTVRALPDRLRGVALLCTRGYPTRDAHDAMRAAQKDGMPIAALVDGDPHGMRIALTCMGLTRDPKPRVAIRWIGVRPSRLPIGAAGRAPMTGGDQTVLSLVKQRAADALGGLRAEEETLRETLTEILKEAEWMTQHALKCAIQAWPEGPMDILQRAGLLTADDTHKEV